MDCLACGACCATPDGSLRCGVTEADRRRLGWRGWGVLDHAPRVAPGIDWLLQTRWHGYSAGPLAGRRLSECVGLTGEAMSAVRCRWYEQRPQACRDLEAGSEGCLAARARIGAGT